MHASDVVKLFHKQTHIPSNFLYFFTVYLFSGFSVDYNQLLLTSVILLSLSIGLKAFFSLNFFENEMHFKRESPWVIYGLIFTLLIIAPIPLSIPFQDFFFKGKIVINVWHNSTTIFMVPFSLLLHWQSLKTIENKSIHNLGYTLILIVINILIKPSYFFVYGMVFPLFLLFKYKLTNRFFIYLIPVIVGVLFILIEYYVIYHLGGGHISSKGRDKIIIAPFLIWRNIIPLSNIPASILFSTMFPVFYFIFFPREMLKTSNLYAIVFFIVALLIFTFIAETGKRQYDGNFAWQNIICCYILFITTIVNLYHKSISKGIKDLKMKLKLSFLWGIYSTHFIAGIIYIYRMLYSII